MMRVRVRGRGLCLAGERERLIGTMLGRNRSPAVKILWLWTLGTAAVLVTTVVKTRLKDLEALMKAEQLKGLNENIPSDNSALLIDEVIDEGLQKV
ncbi:uncharacterized protein LOC18437188 [Amborella trichopoda]|nr:uncharacterized protein LOC18437188 [Amborella trichopoda]|eukprot:XP_006847469.2 uncharacterized protein LOC18437188 [Amborella trichopoda]